MCTCGCPPDGFFEFVFPTNNRHPLPSADDQVRCYSTESGELLGMLTGHKHAVHSISFDPTGRLVLTASVDTALIWAVDDGPDCVRLAAVPALCRCQLGTRARHESHDTCLNMSRGGQSLSLQAVRGGCGV